VYVSQTQNIEVQSDAIMVPQRTSRGAEDIVKYVVIKYRPKIVLGNREPILIGEAGILFIVDSYCNNEHNTGFILVVTRNNIVVVLVGCGSDVTREFMVRAANLVDGHILRPPSTDEIAKSESEQSEVMPEPTVTTISEPTMTPVPTLILSPIVGEWKMTFNWLEPYDEVTYTGTLFFNPDGTGVYTNSKTTGDFTWTFENGQLTWVIVGSDATYIARLIDGRLEGTMRGTMGMGGVATGVWYAVR
jgi:hypothetical protein